MQRKGLSRCFQCCLFGLVGAYAFQATPCASWRRPSAARCRWTLYEGLSDYEDWNVSSNNNNNVDETPEPNSDEEIDPICRVVASSDGKIPQLPVSSLSPSSKTLLEKIELLYSAQSQKELRDLAYMLPRSTNKKAAYHDEVSFDALENEQEEKLVSILKQSLDDGGFKLLDQRDLDLCCALNAGYLLRLSLLPNVKDLDAGIGKEFYPELYAEKEVDGKEGKDGTKKNDNNNLLFDGRVLIFRRGYSEEITTGRLLLQKLDYLQASIVQRSTTGLTRTLGAFEERIVGFVMNGISNLNNFVESVYQRLLQQCREFAINMLENFGLSQNEFVSGIISKAVEMNNTSDGMEDASNSDETISYNIRGNRIFKLGRYRTKSSAIIPESLDLNDALSPFLLCEVGTNTTDNTVEKDLYEGMNSGEISCQYDDTLFSMCNPTASRSSYKPAAARLLERVSIQNTVDFLSRKGRRDLISNYFRSSTLVEPAYEETVVIWRPKRKKKLKIQQLYPPKWLYEAAKVFDVEDRLPKPQNTTKADTADDGPMPLEIRAFYDVPMANIEAVLPKTKLIFRPADAIVFDLVSVVSFLAVAGSLKFDSPKLDLLALVSIVFFGLRTFFRYSNKYARYDLLVNKFLTSKLAHRGPGALKYIVSEANANKALRYVRCVFFYCCLKIITHVHTNCGTEQC